MTTRPDNLAAARRYLAAIESGASGDALAAFAMFVEYRDGKIARQHNYDCFEAW